MITDKLKVLLVDDHAVVRAGFRMLLSAQEFIGEILDVDRGELVIQEYSQFQPDVVVMDLSMPGIGGLEAIRRLTKQYNNALVVVYSIHDEAIYVERAMKAGAKGYVTKNGAPEILAEAVKKVFEGQVYIESVLTSALDDEPKKEAELYSEVVDLLSPREFDVFCLLAKGMNAHEASEQLCLGYKTVANYSTQIKHKLNANTAAELAHIAMVLGVVKR
jgi:two-component system invasion response regulator UvrY